MKKMSKIRLNRNAGNDKMEKADRTPLTKWEKVQITTATLASFWCFVMFILVNEEKKYVL